MVLGDESSIRASIRSAWFHAKTSQWCPWSFFITAAIVSKVIRTLHMLIIPLRTIGAAPSSLAAAETRISKNEDNIQ